MGGAEASILQQTGGTDYSMAIGRISGESSASRAGSKARGERREASGEGAEYGSSGECDDDGCNHRMRSDSDDYFKFRIANFKFGIFIFHYHCHNSPIVRLGIIFCTAVVETLGGSIAPNDSHQFGTESTATDLLVRTIGARAIRTWSNR